MNVSHFPVRLYLLPDAPEGSDGPSAALTWPATGRGWFGPLHRQMFPNVSAAVAAKRAIEQEARA